MYFISVLFPICAIHWVDDLAGPVLDVGLRNFVKKNQKVHLTKDPKYFLLFISLKYPGFFRFNFLISQRKQK